VTGPRRPLSARQGREGAGSTPARFPRLTEQSFAEASVALRALDPQLGSWMEVVGTVELRRQRHHFHSLCRAVISQQLGTGAARTIHKRFLELVGRPTPRLVLDCPLPSLRACGLSARKVEYLQGIASQFEEGPLRTLRWGRLADERVIERLTELPGIGRWTAEMFLIFSLGRADVFSVGDLALCSAVQRIAGRKLSPTQIERRARVWSPYRSVASHYLWKIAHWRGTTPAT